MPNRINEQLEGIKNDIKKVKELDKQINQLGKIIEASDVSLKNRDLNDKELHNKVMEKLKEVGKIDSSFSPSERNVVQLTKDYIKKYYSSPSAVLDVFQHMKKLEMKNMEKEINKKISNMDENLKDSFITELKKRKEVDVVDINVDTDDMLLKNEKNSITTITKEQESREYGKLMINSGELAKQLIPDLTKNMTNYKNIINDEKNKYLEDKYQQFIKISDEQRIIDDITNEWQWAAISDEESFVFKGNNIFDGNENNVGSNELNMVHAGSLLLKIDENKLFNSGSNVDRMVLEILENIREDGNYIVDEDLIKEIQGVKDMEINIVQNEYSKVYKTMKKEDMSMAVRSRGPIGIRKTGEGVLEPTSEKELKIQLENFKKMNLSKGMKKLGIKATMETQALRKDAVKLSENANSTLDNIKAQNKEYEKSNDGQKVNKGSDLSRNILKSRKVPKNELTNT